MGEFFLGVLVGQGLAQGILYWWVFRRDSSVLVIDRYWLENPDRWEWLRTYELEKE